MMNKDKRLFFLLNKARHSIYNYMDQLMVESIEVPVAQVSALLILNIHEGCLVKDLSTFLGLNKSGTTGLTDRMVKNQLIRKITDETDGRAFRIMLTQKGKDVLKKAKPIIKTENEKIQQGFNEDEMETVIRFLNNLSHIHR